jgi:hypothetical protein
LSNIGMGPIFWARSYEKGFEFLRPLQWRHRGLRFTFSSSSWHITNFKTKFKALQPSEIKKQRQIFYLGIKKNNLEEENIQKFKKSKN